MSAFDDWTKAMAFEKLPYDVPVPLMREAFNAGMARAAEICQGMNQHGSEFDWAAREIIAARDGK